MPIFLPVWFPMIPQSGDPNVDIDNNSQTDLDVQMETPDASETDPAQGADSSGLEQTIQADPVKSLNPRKPEHPPAPPRCRMTTTERMCRRRSARPRDEAPPTYEETPTVTPTRAEPAAGSTGSSGQVYVPQLRLCGKQRVGTRAALWMICMKAGE